MLELEVVAVAVVEHFSLARFELELTQPLVLVEALVQLVVESQLPSHSHTS